MELAEKLDSKRIEINNIISAQYGEIEKIFDEDKFAIRFTLSRSVKENKIIRHLNIFVTISRS